MEQTHQTAKNIVKWIIKDLKPHPLRAGNRSSVRE